MTRQVIAPCFKLKDSSSFRYSARRLTSGGDPRSALAMEMRLAHQLIDQNRIIFDQYAVTVSCRDKADGSGAELEFETHDVVGAFPLKSPTSGTWDYGIVIEPRQGWTGFGGMLSSMGWKIVPELQRLPTLPRSAREIPSWVIGSVILVRIESLLKDLARKFELKKDFLSTPRGRIDWSTYVATQIPRLKLLDIPCEFSELTDHKVLMGIIHHTLRKLCDEMSALTDGGAIVVRLLQRARELLQKVSAYSPVRPAPQMFEPWFYGKKLPTDIFAEGLEAMQWSAENRGLAGLSDFRGLPWKMSISAFFEAFVETVLIEALKYTGGSLRSGRNNETVIPISWDHVSSSTQKSLRPDFVIERGGEVVIVDAKFKSYWYDMTFHKWQKIDITTQNEHRADLLQVLAYSTCYSCEHLTVCLVYPCEEKLYNSLCAKDTLERRASVYSGVRKINIILTAIPMRGNVADVAKRLSGALLRENEEQ